MKTDIKQSAIQAMNVYQRAQQKGRDVMVSGKGEIREVTVFDRIKESLRSLKPEHKVRNWQAEARQHIKNLLIQDSQLFKPVLSADEKTALDNMANKIFNLSKSSNQYWADMLGTERLNNSLLTDVLTNINSMDEKVDPDIYRYVRPVLQNNHGNLEEAIAVGSLSKLIKKEKGLTADTALNAASKMQKLMNQDPALDAATAFKITVFTGELIRNGLISKSNASTTGLEVFKLMGRFETDAREAVEILEATQSIMKFKNLSKESAQNLAYQRTLEMRKMQSALPRGKPLSIVDGSSNKLSLSISEAGKKGFLDYLKSAHLKENQKNGLSSQFLADTTRAHFAFQTDKGKKEFSAKLLPHVETQEAQIDQVSKMKDALISELHDFAGNGIVAESLSRILNQSGGNAIMETICFDLAAPDQTRFMMDEYMDVDSTAGQGTHKKNYIEISKSPEGNVQVRYILLARAMNVTKGTTGENWPINLGLGLDLSADVELNTNNHTARYDFFVEYKLADLKRGKIAPQFLEQPSVEIQIRPDWEIIDDKFFQPR